MMHLAKGQKYTRDRKIGQGSYGTIFLCTNTDNGKEFAEKIIDKGAINRRYLKCETDLMRRLTSKNSAHTMPIFGAFESSHELFAKIRKLKKKRKLRKKTKKKIST